ncbi:transmembrane protein 216 [Haematobia irritans]|uniref:transmembrane protein 216 n=1 Tax=Haematobia irritans TaxID=7368 RepID=UPI003F4F9FC7
MEASLMYEILMYLNSFYFGLYAAFKVCVSILKFILLTYPENAALREMILLLVMCVLETVRIILGRRSSLSARAWQAIASVVLTLPSLILVIYLCFFQTSVLKLEVIMSALMITLHVAELVFAGMFICTMCRPVTYT